MARQVRRYTAEDVHVQTNMEAVRANVGMYLGSDRSATLQAFAEVFQNACDEARECGDGRMRVDIVNTHPHTVVRIADRGRGIPVERHRATKCSTLETVFTTLHAGGKSDRKSAYGARTFGRHGVGVAAVNACCKELIVWTHRNDRWHRMDFARGRVTDHLHAIERPPLAWPRGTIVQYTLDDAVLPDPLVLADARNLCALATYWDPFTVRYRDPEQAALLVPHRPEDLLRIVLRRADARILAGPIVANANGVRAAVAWTNALDTTVAASVAGAQVPSGTHVQGLETACTNALRRATRDKTVDGTVGLVAVLDVSVDRPSFGGQTKRTLRTGETARRVEAVLTKPLIAWTRANARAVEQVQAHVDAQGRINQKAQEAREIAREARKSLTHRQALPYGFKSATGYPPAKRELYLMEGQSALGTAINAKMPWQEILPMQGKLPNLLKRGDLVGNEIVNNIINVIGYDRRRPERALRVGRVLILTDADEDGDHIKTLVLAAMYHVMPDLLQRDIVYGVNAPLFEAMTRDGRQVMGNVLADMERRHGRLRNVNRMKGWGSAEADLLREVAFDPVSRSIEVLPRLTRDDERRFVRLMGKDSTERKRLTQRNRTAAQSEVRA